MLSKTELFKKNILSTKQCFCPFSRTVLMGEGDNFGMHGLNTNVVHVANVKNTDYILITFPALLS